MALRPALDPEKLESQLVQLTRDLVLIESTDAKPEERRRCFQLLRNHLEELPSARLLAYQKNGYESLVVLPEGIDRPAALFCAHLDVVEHLGPECYRSRLADGRIYGPGAGDMKGALALLVILFRNQLALNPRLPLGLAVTSDEERGGENGTRYLVDEVGLRADCVIMPDGGSIDRITVEEKGILHARVTARGKSAHAARPWLGRNPLQALIHGLLRLEQRFSDMPQTSEYGDPAAEEDHWHPTCSVTQMDTPNESVNCIPDRATAILDIRFPPPSASEDMLSIAREALGPAFEVETLIASEPTQLLPDPRFVEATQAVLGRPPTLARVAGGSDARFFRNYGIPVMLSRPKVGNLHGRDEWIDIRSMLDYYRICERYLAAIL